MWVQNITDTTRYALAFCGFILMSLLSSKLLIWQRKFVDSRTEVDYNNKLENFQDRSLKLVTLNGTMCHATHGKYWHEFRENFKNTGKYYFKLENMDKHDPGMNAVITGNILMLSKLVIMSSILMDKSPLTERPYPKFISNFKTYWCLFSYCSMTFLENQMSKTNEFILYANGQKIWDFEDDDQKLPENIEDLTVRIDSIIHFL